MNRNAIARTPTPISDIVTTLFLNMYFRKNMTTKINEISSPMKPALDFEPIRHRINPIITMLYSIICFFLCSVNNRPVIMGRMNPVYNPA